MGERGAQAIADERERGGPYGGAADLAGRTGLKPQALESLVQAGAFDGLTPNRRLALWDAGLAVRPLRNGQAALALPIGGAPDLDDLGAFERMMGEYRVMGLYPRGHVMEFVRPHLDAGVLPTAAVEALPDGQDVRVAGWPVARQHPRGREGTVFVTIEDEEGDVQLILWPDVFARCRRALGGRIILARGTDLALRRHDQRDRLAYRGRPHPRAAARRPRLALKVLRSYPCDNAAGGPKAMCGRYSLVMDLSVLAQRFDFDDAELSAEPSYNIAPTQRALTVREEGGGRKAAFMRWGLIPSWAKDASIGARMINARAETVADKPAFRTALSRRRCLVLADGFYEWQRSYPEARPSAPCASRSGRASRSPSRGCGRSGATPRAFPSNRAPSSPRRPTSCSRPSTTACPSSCPGTQSRSGWMSPVGDPGLLANVLRPYPSDAMDAYEVPPLVNSAANDTPEVLARVRVDAE